MIIASCSMMGWVDYHLKQNTSQSICNVSLPPLHTIKWWHLMSYVLVIITCVLIPVYHISAKDSSKFSRQETRYALVKYIVHIKRLLCPIKEFPWKPRSSNSIQHRYSPRSFNKHPTWQRKHSSRRKKGRKEGRTVYCGGVQLVMTHDHCYCSRSLIIIGSSSPL